MLILWSRFYNPPALRGSWARAYATENATARVDPRRVSSVARNPVTSHAIGGVCSAWAWGVWRPFFLSLSRSHNIFSANTPVGLWKHLFRSKLHSSANSFLGSTYPFWRGHTGIYQQSCDSCKHKDPMNVHLRITQYICFSYNTNITKTRLPYKGEQSENIDFTST